LFSLISDISNFNTSTSFCNIAILVAILFKLFVLSLISKLLVDIAYPLVSIPDKSGDSDALDSNCSIVDSILANFVNPAPIDAIKP
jgi:hypothetical protein